MKKPTPKLIRSQLVFAAECIIAAAIDRADGERGDNLRKIAEGSETYVNGAIECAGMALAILAAQVTGEGVGINDALAMPMPRGDRQRGITLREVLEQDARATSHDAHAYAVEFVKGVEGVQS